MHWWREKGYDGQRTEQHCGKAGDSDVVLYKLPNFHIESKGTKSPKLVKSTLLKWYNQLEEDTSKTGKFPFLQYTANGKEPLIFLPMKIYRDFADRFPLFKGQMCVGESVTPHIILQEQQVIRQLKEALHLEDAFSSEGILYLVDTGKVFYINTAERLFTFITSLQTHLETLST